ncbi:MAG: GPR endopeptidase [Candidatus Heteroscillospira sp.]|jgi:spore protease
MKNFAPRTDLAVESREFLRENAPEAGELPGVRALEENRRGFAVTTVSVLDERGSDVLCKPIGEYITVELDRLIRREEDSFEQAAELAAELIRGLLGEVTPDSQFLVIGLGNEAITPDAIGSWALDNLLVTRHLKEKQIPDFAHFSSVAGIRAGVLGTTGIESAHLSALVTEAVKPDAVLVVDALASRELHRLCGTLQISNAGIVPGSGVGNARAALTKETLGVPVIAIGVPTVVDAATLTADMARAAGVELDPDKLPAPGMIVTPRDIDRSARDAAKLVGYGLDLALHPGLTVSDIDMLLS